MKTVMVLMMVLWAGIGWAVELTLKDVQAPTQDPFRCREDDVSTGYVGYNRQLLRCVNGQWEDMQTHCEIKMEAAMEAMEPLAFGHPTPNQFLVALRLFNEAKACWRKP